MLKSRTRLASGPPGKTKGKDLIQLDQVYMLYKVEVFYPPAINSRFDPNI